MCEHPGERPRDPAEVERLDEQARVPDLPVSQPTVQLRFDRLVAVLDLLLERLEPRKIALLLGDLQHDTGAVGADELVLEVDLADVEAEPLPVRARQPRPEACTLERARVAPLLARVAEARHLCRTCSREKTAERLRAADRNDPHALGSEITSKTSGERLERDSI